MSELNDQLSSVLTDMIGSATSVKDFVLSETPEVINQLLMWKCAESVIYTLIGAAYAILFIILLKKYFKDVFPQFKKEFADGYNDEIPYMVTAFGIVLTVWPPFAFADLVWLKIWIAPKLFLIEYIAEIAK